MASIIRKHSSMHVSLNIYIIKTRFLTTDLTSCFYLALIGFFERLPHHKTIQRLSVPTRCSCCGLSVRRNQPDRHCSGSSENSPTRSVSSVQSLDHDNSQLRTYCVTVTFEMLVSIKLSYTADTVKINFV